jgi:CRISPR system Cascade subunit CasD
VSTLLLRFAAPMQSWGLDKFERRGTSRMPTKSAVIGMVMAAMGMKRDREIPDEFRTLRFGVRGDDEGIVIRDFHTVKQRKPDKVTMKVRRIDDNNTILAMETKLVAGGQSYITNRFYLCDAVFLVGLEGDEQLLKRIEHALLNPVFPIYLGRKSCPPEGRLVLGIRNLSLQEALKQEPWLLQHWRQKQKQRRNKNQNIYLRLVVDAGVNDNGYLIDDMPISFNYEHRRHGARKVMDLPSVLIKKQDRQEHDAFATAKGEG